MFFNRYRALRSLGDGGFGIVWLCWDTTVEMNVAVKVLQEKHRGDPTRADDLRKELKRGLALSHPNIVRLLHYGADEHHTALIMEYVEGKDLRQLCAEQPGHCFEPAAILPWLRQLGSALDYAHQQQRIVHCDLKPHNLLIDTRGQLKVTDFGLVNALSTSHSLVSHRHGSGGTPHYMSRQQLYGEAPDIRDDVYSFGATIYHLLTGSPPFFRGDIAVQVAEVTPPSMTERRKELGVTGRPPIPPAWERAVASALAKEREERPATAGALVAQLEAINLPASPPAESLTEPHRTQPPANRQPARVIPSVSSPTPAPASISGGYQVDLQGPGGRGRRIVLWAILATLIIWQREAIGVWTERASTEWMIWEQGVEIAREIAAQPVTITAQRDYNYSSSYDYGDYNYSSSYDYYPDYSYGGYDYPTPSYYSGYQDLGSYTGYEDELKVTVKIRGKAQRLNVGQSAVLLIEVSRAHPTGLPDSVRLSPPVLPGLRLGTLKGRVFTEATSTVNAHAGRDVASFALEIVPTSQGTFNTEPFHLQIGDEEREWGGITYTVEP